ncbi:GNAT family N-acetyltransferase [Yonghaparkia sp. Soil809]|uniref:GNAT family N-acetyltransferase n=1 Tax=Yonghaparkia sp. Soil809 TaxID=1736417 RepID=UPI0006F21918|nr:GNAT family N-acetyltransferase [Yonghaparkia sp. Soil809]KRF32770.1 hypothetical protein ASG83_01635 [Yonghaparkia sp. Soil809]
MLLETHVLQDTDPDLPGLLGDGFEVVGESWGAELEIDGGADTAALLERLRGFVASARGSGLELRELAPRDAPAIEALDAESWADVPTTPATVHAPVSAADVHDWARRGRRAFGALDGDRLVGVCVGSAGDNDFVVVAPDQRDRGIGAAVVAAWMLGAIAAGERAFSAGGASQNARSLGMIRAVGFRVTERWLSLQRP